MNVTFTYLFKQADVKLNHHWSTLNLTSLASESVFSLYVWTENETDIAFQLDLLENYEMFCV